jgi:hypothetical protein
MAKRSTSAPTAVVDTPEPGIWKMRLSKDGWPDVPVRIEHAPGIGWRATIDGVAGEIDPDPLRAPGVLRIWHGRKTPIGEAEYRFLTETLKDWAEKFYPDHPLLHPEQPYRAGGLRPIPLFAAPKAAAPPGPEPLPENRPSAPKPLDAKQVVQWLNYEYDPLTKAIHADVEQLSKDGFGPDGKPLVIDDEATLARVGANIQIARAHLKQAEDARVLAKKPYLEGGKTVDTWFGRAKDALFAAINPVQAAMNDWAAREDARKRREAALEAARAQEEADRAARAAAAALAREEAQKKAMDEAYGEGVIALPLAPATTALLDEATDAAQAAQAAEALAVGSSADLTRTHTAYGGVMSGQETFDFEVVDIAKIPLSYLMVNETLLRADIRAFARGNTELARKMAEEHRSLIPGVKITRTVGMRNR